MSIAKKGIRIDELLNYFNEYLSVETYYYSFYNTKDKMNLVGNSIEMFDNKDVPGIEIHLFKNKEKPLNEIERASGIFYEYDASNLYKLLNKKVFYFFVIGLYSHKNKGADQIYVPNETFTNLEEATNRAMSFIYTPNLIKIKRFIEAK